MTQARLELSPYTQRVLDVIKGKFGLKNRTEALNKFALEYGSEFVEPPVNEDYLKELDGRYNVHIKKNKFKPMSKKEFDELFD